MLYYRIYRHLVDDGVINGYSSRQYMGVIGNEIVNYFSEEINIWFEKFIKHNRELNKHNFHIETGDRLRLWLIMSENKSIA